MQRPIAFVLVGFYTTEARTWSIFHSVPVGILLFLIYVSTVEDAHNLPRWFACQIACLPYRCQSVLVNQVVPVLHKRISLLPDRRFLMHPRALRALLLEWTKADGSWQRCIESACRHWARILQPTSMFLEDRDFALMAIGATPIALRHAPQHFRLDRDFVLEAVAREPAALQYLPYELSSNSAFVLQAFHQVPAARQYAHHVSPAELAAGPTVGSSWEAFVFNAVEIESAALQYAPEQLRSDKAFVLKVLHRFPECQPYAPAPLHEHLEQYVLEAVQEKPEALQHAPERIRASPAAWDSLVKRALRADSWELDLEARAFGQRCLEDNTNICAVIDTAVAQCKHEDFLKPVVENLIAQGNLVAIANIICSMSSAHGLFKHPLIPFL